MKLCLIVNSTLNAAQLFSLLQKLGGIGGGLDDVPVYGGLLFTFGCRNFSGVLDGMKQGV